MKRSKAMDRMLVVIFDRESQAFEGKKALIQLEHAGDIVIYDCAVVARNADGTATVRQSDDPRPVGTLVGTTLGALFGLLGGPAGAAVGAAAGLAVGASVDVDHARVGDDFVEDVREKLLPEKFALMAEIQEDWTDPVDTRMEALGGTVFRRALSEVKHKVHEENTAAMKADRAQMKAEHAQAHADCKPSSRKRSTSLTPRYKRSSKNPSSGARQRRRRKKPRLSSLKPGPPR